MRIVVEIPDDVARHLPAIARIMNRSDVPVEQLASELLADALNEVITAHGLDLELPPPEGDAA